MEPHITNPKWRHITFKKGRNRGKKCGIPPNKNNKGKEPIEAQSYQKTRDKIAIGNPHTSTITLNVNELNSPVKNQSQSSILNQK